MLPYFLIPNCRQISYTLHQKGIYGTCLCPRRRRVCLFFQMEKKAKHLEHLDTCYNFL